jgi:hypothetical protein
MLQRKSNAGTAIYPHEALKMVEHWLQQIEDHINYDEYFEPWDDPEEGSTATETTIYLAPEWIKIRDCLYLVQECLPLVKDVRRRIPKSRPSEGGHWQWIREPKSADQQILKLHPRDCHLCHVSDT